MTDTVEYAADPYVGCAAGVYIGDGIYLRGADEPPVRTSTVHGWLGH